MQGSALMLHLVAEIHRDIFSLNDRVSKLEVGLTYYKSKCSNIESLEKKKKKLLATKVHARECKLDWPSRGCWWPTRWMKCCG